MFDRKDMVDAAFNPRQLTSKGTTLQDQLCGQEVIGRSRRKLIRNGSM